MRFCDTDTVLGQAKIEVSSWAAEATRNWEDMKGVVDELRSKNTDCSATYYVYRSLYTSSDVLLLTEALVPRFRLIFIIILFCIDKMAGSSTIFRGLEPHCPVGSAAYGLAAFCTAQSSRNKIDIFYVVGLVSVCMASSLAISFS